MLVDLFQDPLPTVRTDLGGVRSIGRNHCLASCDEVGTKAVRRSGEGRHHAAGDRDFGALATATTGNPGD